MLRTSSPAAIIGRCLPLGCHCQERIVRRSPRLHDTRLKFWLKNPRSGSKCRKFKAFWGRASSIPRGRVQILGKLVGGCHFRHKRSSLTQCLASYFVRLTLAEHARKIIKNSGDMSSRMFRNDKGVRSDWLKCVRLTQP